MSCQLLLYINRNSTVFRGIYIVKCFAHSNVEFPVFFFIFHLMLSFLLFLTQPFCRSHAGCLSQIFVKESVWTGAGRKLGRAGNPVDYLRPFVTSTSLKYMNISTLSNRLGVEIKYKDLRISQFFSVSLSKSLTH